MFGSTLIPAHGQGYRFRIFMLFSLFGVLRPSQQCQGHLASQLTYSYFFPRQAVF